MDELEALRRAFEDAQSSTVVKLILSERTCVDILQKLINLKKVNLVSLTDGTGFVTLTHLDGEIITSLRASGGRIKITELVNTLGVSFQTIFSRCELLIKKERKRLFYTDGELIRSTYFDQISEEINEWLQESGQVHISDIAQHYSLPIEFLEEQLSIRVPSLIKGTLGATSLNTPEFQDRILSIIMGWFLGSTIPVPLSRLCQYFKLDVLSVSHASQKLLNKNPHLGQIRNEIFVPKYYFQNQSSKVDSFFKDNHFFTFNSSTDTDLFNPKLFLVNKYPDGICLSKYFIGKSLKESLQQHLEECVRFDWWQDLSLILPPSMDIKDAQELFSIVECKLPSKMKLTWVEDSYIVISSGFISTLKSKLDDYMQICLSEFLSTKTTFQPAFDESQSGSNKEEFSQTKVRGKFKSKGATEKLSLNKGKAKQTSEQNSGTIIKNFLEDQSKLRGILGEYWEEFDEDVGEKIIDIIIPEFFPIYNQLKNLKSEARQDQTKFDFQKLSNQITAQAEITQLHFEALDAFIGLSTSPPNNHLLLKVFISQTFSKIIDPLISIVLYDETGENQKVTPQNRMNLIDQLPKQDISAAHLTDLKDLIEALKKLIGSLNKRIMNEFVMDMCQTLNLAKIYANPLNKKRKKQLISELKTSTHASLEKCVATEPTNLLKNYLIFEILNKKGLYFLIPDEFWGINSIWEEINSQPTFKDINIHATELYNELNKLNNSQKSNSDEENNEIKQNTIKIAVEKAANDLIQNIEKK